MNNWKTYKLRELTKKIGSGATPKGGKEAYLDQAEISLIRSQNILDFEFSQNGLAFISEKQANELKNVIIEKDDILLNITGDSVARVCKVPDELIPARVNQHVAIIRANKEKVDSDFLKYYLLEPSFKRHMLGLASTGATRNALTKGMIENFDIKIPDLQTQQSIASILSSLDNKVKLNLQTNQTLETMVQAIFKEWFVNFNYPGFDGDLNEGMPKGWKEVSLNDVIELIVDHRGKTPTKLGGEWVEQGIPAISAKNVKDGRLVNLDDVGYVDAALFDKWMKEKLKPFDILLTSEGPLGEVAILISNINYCLSQRLFAIRTNFSCKPSYLYYLLRSEIGKSNIQKRATGSTVVGIRQSELRQVEVPLPPLEIQTMFDDIVSPCLVKIDENFNEIATLVEIRNALLPKLMNGQIEIKE